MKIVRCKYQNRIIIGQLQDDFVIEITNFSFQDSNINFGDVIPITKLKFMAPVSPSKVVGLAYNYKDLVGEQEYYEEPLIFLKSGNSVIGPEEAIKVYKGVKTWAEVEIAIIIAKTCKNVSAQDASEYIFGYTIGNDVTMENVHGRDHHLARSKSNDTFCPIGPFVDTNFDTNNVRLTNCINGNLFQDGRSSNRIVNDFEAVSLVSKFITLFPGDIILTGTPANAMNSLINGGDIVTLSIDNLGQLNNSVQYI